MVLKGSWNPSFFIGNFFGIFCRLSSVTTFEVLN